MEKPPTEGSSVGHKIAASEAGSLYGDRPGQHRAQEGPLPAEGLVSLRRHQSEPDTEPESQAPPILWYARGNILGKQGIVPGGLQDQLKYWSSHRKEIERTLYAAGTYKLKPEGSKRDEEERAKIRAEVVILNETLEQVQWAEDNPPSLIINSANCMHLHHGGIAQAISKIYPGECVRHMETVPLPLPNHTTTLCPVDKGVGTIPNVQGIIHHAWKNSSNLSRKDLINLRYHVSMSYAGPYMVATALRYITPYVDGERIDPQQVIMTIHGSGIYGYPGEETKKACMIWARNLAIQGFRVVILIPSGLEYRQFLTEWEVFLTGDQVMEKTVEERDVLDISEALFYANLEESGVLSGKSFTDITLSREFYTLAPPARPKLAPAPSLYPLVDSILHADIQDLRDSLYPNKGSTASLHPVIPSAPEQLSATGRETPLPPYDPRNQREGTEADSLYKPPISEPPRSEFHPRYASSDIGRPLGQGDKEGRKQAIEAIFQGNLVGDSEDMLQQEYERQREQQAREIVNLEAHRLEEAKRQLEWLKEQQSYVQQEAESNQGWREQAIREKEARIRRAQEEHDRWEPERQRLREMQRLAALQKRGRSDPTDSFRLHLEPEHDRPDTRGMVPNQSYIGSYVPITPRAPPPEGRDRNAPRQGDLAEHEYTKPKQVTIRGGKPKVALRGEEVPPSGAPPQRDSATQGTGKPFRSDQIRKDQDEGRTPSDNPEQPLYPNMYPYEIYQCQGKMKVIICLETERNVIKRPPQKLDYLIVTTMGLENLPPDQQSLRGEFKTTWTTEMGSLFSQFSPKERRSNMWTVRHDYPKTKPKPHMPRGYGLIQVKEPITVGEMKGCIKAILKGINGERGGTAIRATTPAKIGGMSSNTIREIWNQGLDPGWAPTVTLVMCEKDKNKYQQMKEDLSEMYENLREYQPSPGQQGRPPDSDPEDDGSDSQGANEDSTSEESSSEGEEEEEPGVIEEEEAQPTVPQKPTPLRKGKDMALLKSQQRSGKKGSGSPKPVRGRDKRSKSITLRKIDPSKPPVAAQGTITGQNGEMYGPYIDNLNDEKQGKTPKASYQWYNPPEEERQAQRYLPTAEEVYGMEGVTQPWKQSYIAHHYNWLRDGVKRRDRSVERQYRLETGHDSEEEEAAYDPPLRRSRSRSSLRTPRQVEWEDEDREVTVISQILAQTPLQSPRRSLSHGSRPAHSLPSANSGGLPSVGMTITEILAMFPKKKEGETPPEYVLRVHEMGIPRETLEDPKVTTMVSINKELHVPRAMTLWDVMQVKAQTLGKNRITELKDHYLKQIIEGTSTLCLAVASLQEAGATDMEMESFLVELNGGESLAIAWRGGGSSERAKAITDWETRREIRKSKKAKNEKAGAPPAQDKGGHREQLRPGSGMPQNLYRSEGYRAPNSYPSERNNRPAPGSYANPPRTSGPPFVSGNRPNYTQTNAGRRSEMPPKDNGGIPQSNNQSTGQTENTRYYMRRPLRPGAPSPPAFVPKNQFDALPREEKDRVMKEKNDYLKKWVIS